MAYYETLLATWLLFNALLMSTNGDDDDGSQSEVDHRYQCNTCGDCEVKNVGNCCGYYPQCVNINFQPDLEKVKESCANSNVISPCGWTQIDACTCTEGRCQAAADDDAGEACEEDPSGAFLAPPQPSLSPSAPPTWQFTEYPSSGPSASPTQRPTSSSSSDDVDVDEGVDSPLSSRSAASKRIWSGTFHSHPCYLGVPISFVAW